MNDNEPLAIGDRVQRRDQPWLKGTVWSIEHGMVIVDWDDNPEADENIYFREPQRWLQKITPAQPPHPGAKGHLQPV